MFPASGNLRSVALFALLLLSSAISRAQTQTLFFQPPSFGCFSEFQVTADFNQDGIFDLACASGVVWFGSADGTFHSVNVGAGGQSIAIADFNGDGKPDLVFSSSNASFLSVLLDNGDGTFQSRYTIEGIGVALVAAADINGDGKPDVVGISAYPFGLFEFLGRGDGTFADPVQIPVKGFNFLPALKLLGSVLVCLMVSGLLFLAACGGGSGSSNGGGGSGGSGGTPSGTYTITLEATASSTVNTTNVTLTVQ